MSQSSGGVFSNEIPFLKNDSSLCQVDIELANTGTHTRVIYIQRSGKKAKGVKASKSRC